MQVPAMRLSCKAHHSCSIDTAVHVGNPPYFRPDATAQPQEQTAGLTSQSIHARGLVCLTEASLAAYKQCEVELAQWAQAGTGTGSHTDKAWLVQALPVGPGGCQSPEL